MRTYIVKDSTGKINTFQADNVTWGSNGLYIRKGDKVIAVFVSWIYWVEKEKDE
jgi:hypothetical protein